MLLIRIDLTPLKLHGKVAPELTYKPPIQTTKSEAERAFEMAQVTLPRCCWGRTSLLSRGGWCQQAVLRAESAESGRSAAFALPMGLDIASFWRPGIFILGYNSERGHVTCLALCSS